MTTVRSSPLSCVTTTTPRPAETRCFPIPALTARQDIAGFGIAGRTWEAAYLLGDYLLPPPPPTPSTTAAPPKPPQFDPPCPIFGPTDDGSAQPGIEPAQTVLELGSGTGFLSLAIAPSLRRHRRKRTTLIMTDLDNVCPLLEDNLARAQQRWLRNTEREPGGKDPTEQGLVTAAAAAEPDQVDVLVRPLPWGDEPSLLRLVKEEEFEPDIILASDLIYFEFLYGPLLRTLIALTEPSTTTESRKATTMTPTVIFSYKVRSLTREEPFWRAFGAFHLCLSKFESLSS
jgi:hypothetical protein